VFENLKRLFFQNKTAKKEKPLNLYQYKFLRYKRERDEAYPLKLSKVHTPCEKGLISVVLPVYNGADLIKSSIESVLNQTEKNFEFIIINDGSTDNTKEVIEEYAKRDKRITVINQENRRIPRTLSRGFSVAKGEFFTWTSADNIMPCDFLFKMKQELVKNPDTAMVFANMRLINEKGKTHKNHGWFEIPFGSGNVIFPKNTLELNTYANNTIGAAFMYRKSAKDVLGCYSSFKHTLEDYDYWMRMNSLLNIHHTSFCEPIYYYRWHSGSLTAKDKELGITKNRYKLMLLDDARRDFYLSPLLWYIKSDEKMKGYAEEFKARLLKCGHKLVEEAEIKDLYFGKEAHNFVAAVFGDEKLCDFLPTGVKKVHFAENPETDFIDGYDITASFGCESINSENNIFVFEDVDTAFSYVDAKIKNDLMYRIEEIIESEKKNLKEISFILCTNKNSEMLSECLEALANQSLEKDKYEIIFVNNSPKDSSLKELVLDVGKKYPGLSINYITAPVPGLSSARNAGLFEASGEILLYIDDDAVADESLAKEVVEAFKNNPEAGIIGGNIILEVPKEAKSVVTKLTRPLWSELVLDFDKFRYAKDYGEYPYGANFAIRRQTLMQIGGFRTLYGRVGSNFAGGEETLCCFMTEETGQKIGLEPKMKVTHKVDKSRFTKEHIEKTAYAGLHTQYRMRRDVYAPQDWSDHSLDERRKKMLAEMNRCEKDSPDYLLFNAYAKALEDIIKLRQEDYAELEKNKTE